MCLHYLGLGKMAVASGGGEGGGERGTKCQNYKLFVVCSSIMVHL